MGIMNMFVNMALGKVKNSLVNPKLAGMGIVDSLTWNDSRLHADLRLTGMEDVPIAVDCGRISIAPDGSAVTLDELTSSMPFVNNALKMFVEGKAISVPEGMARAALMGAKKALGA